MRLRRNRFATFRSAWTGNVLDAVLVSAPVPGEGLRQTLFFRRGLAHPPEADRVVPLSQRRLLLLRELLDAAPGRRAPDGASVVPQLERAGYLLDAEDRRRRPLLRPGRLVASPPPGRRRVASAAPGSLADIAAPAAGYLSPPGLELWLPFEGLPSARNGRLRPRSPDLRGLARTLEQQRFVHLAGLLPVPYLNVISRYYRSLVDGGFCTVDSRGTRRWTASSETLGIHALQGCRRFAESLAGRRLRGTYSFFSEYWPGHALQRHVDTELCEYTLLLQLYGRPAGSVETWPFCLEQDGRARALYLKPGDGLMFRGRELPHWRPELADGRRVATLLLHYVAEEDRS